MNKRLKYWIGCGLCCLGSLGLAGCSGDDMPGASGSGGDEGEPVALSFRLCRLVAGEASTRVDGDPADMADGKTTSSDGTELIDARGLTLNQILYFVYAGMPVVAYLGDGSYGLICGYDAYNISCLWYPGTEFAYTDKMGLNDAAAFFEGNGGNDFICFLAN